MAKSFCKVAALGNVGKDPEIRSTAGGSLVANFSVATSDRVKDAQGNWTDRTEWLSCVAFGKLAEIIRDYVRKGHKLYLDGRLQTSSWDDKKSGEKKYRTEIIVSDLSLLSGKDEAAPAQQQRGGYQQGQANAAPPSGGYGFGSTTAPDEGDDGIPF